MPLNAHQIQVCAESKALPWVELVPVLEALMPVKFTFSTRRGEGAVGEIILEDIERREPGNRRLAVSSLGIPGGDHSWAGGQLIDIHVRFADDADVPFPFRGRTVRSKVAAGPDRLVLQSDEKALAFSEFGPVWSVSSAGGAKHFRTAFPFPSLPATGTLHNDVFNEERFLELLPLIHWVRETCASTWYEGPPLRACFIFDDPNLHWPRYGFVDYQMVAERAKKENYHVSFATVPLDAWFTHRKTAEIFRTNTDQLSIAVHGNDHTRRELARDYSEAERLCMLRQAIHRIERLEHRAGVKVCRVMVPPHGACSEAVLEALPRCGFEAACISHGSLREHNKTRAWTRNVGYSPSELIQGCPVMPRWGLSSDSTNTILLAAFLEQPIVLRGHQQDLKNGIDVLDHAARVINGLGAVSWSNLTGLSRLNYLWRMDGSTLRLRPLGRKLTVRLPRGAETLVLQNPPHFSWGSWQVSKEDGAPVIVCPSEILSLEGTTNGSISVEALTPRDFSAGNPSKLPSATALFRRLLTEGRDRFLS
jgi:hypothetical protein